MDQPTSLPPPVAAEPLGTDHNLEHCPTTVPPDPEETEVIPVNSPAKSGVSREPLDSYKWIRRIGEGGCGTVDLVEHRELRIPLALKTIRPDLAMNRKARRRFRSEAKIQVKLLHHPAIVRIYDASLSGDGTFFFTMEYVSGQSLDKYLTKGQPMPLPWVVDFLTALCNALQFAHNHGILHNDLKPSNLLFENAISNPAGLKLSDFGLARAFVKMDPNAQGSTTESGVLGASPPYTSPEQTEGLRSANARSDIYSVGVILYELLTGYRPFAGSRARMIADTLTVPAPSFASINPKARVPIEVERVVLRCLEKEPSARYASAKMLLQQFTEAVDRAAAREKRGIQGLFREVLGFLPGIR
jgi:serine/threonine-protein kinase